jgi:hypothetical protein
MRRTLALLTGASLLAGCAGAAPSTSVTATTPPVNEVAVGQLAPGRYTYSGMTPRIEVSVPEGWQTVHLSPEFFDVARERADGFAAVMFFRPPLIIGPPGGAPADDPRDAIALLHQNDRLTVSMERSAYIGGMPGIQVDVSADREDSHILGGDEGLLGIGPEDDLTLTFLQVRDGVLVIGLICPAGQMDAWAMEARPVLASITIGSG